MMMMKMMMMKMMMMMMMMIETMSVVHRYHCDMAKYRCTVVRDCAVT